MCTVLLITGCHKGLLQYHPINHVNSCNCGNQPLSDLTQIINKSAGQSIGVRNIMWMEFRPGPKTLYECAFQGLLGLEGNKNSLHTLSTSFASVTTSPLDALTDVGSCWVAEPIPLTKFQKHLGLYFWCSKSFNCLSLLNRCLLLCTSLVNSFWKFKHAHLSSLFCLL